MERDHEKEILEQIAMLDNIVMQLNQLKTDINEVKDDTKKKMEKALINYNKKQ